MLWHLCACIVSLSGVIFPSICSSALMRVECLVKPFHCFTYHTRRQTILIIQPIHIYPSTPTASNCMCVKPRLIQAQWGFNIIYPFIYLHCRFCSKQLTILARYTKATVKCAFFPKIFFPFDCFYFILLFLFFYKTP